MRYIAWVLDIKIRERWIPARLIFAGMLARSTYLEDFAAGNNLDIANVRLRRIRKRALFIEMVGLFQPARYTIPARYVVAQLTLWSKLPSDGDSVRLDDGLFAKSGNQFMEVAV